MSLSPLPHQTEPLTDGCFRTQQAWWDWFRELEGMTNAATAEAVSATSDYTVRPADQARAIFITGTAQGTLTFGAPSGYSKGHCNRIFNQSSRRWLITMSGVTDTQWLWPGQYMIVATDGTVWGYSPVPRWAGSEGNATAGPNSVTLYVDPAGDDDNDGLSVSEPIKYIQTALQIATYRIDAGVTIQLSASTHVPPVGSINVILRTGVAPGNPSNLIQIIGDTSVGGTSRTLYILQCPAGGSCINVQDHAILGVTGVYCLTTGAGSTAISCRQEAVADIVDVALGAFPGGVHISCTTMAAIGLLSSGSNMIEIYGDAAVHIACSNNAYINYGTFNVHIPGALAFTVYAVAVTGGVIGGGPAPFTGAGYFGCTGQRYVCASGGMIAGQNSGFPFPGTVAGTPVAGAYIPEITVAGAGTYSANNPTTFGLYI